MNILLFGVSNVGKSVAGKLLAEHLNYAFYDLNEDWPGYSSIIFSILLLHQKP